MDASTLPSRTLVTVRTMRMGNFCKQGTITASASEKPHACSTAASVFKSVRLVASCCEMRPASVRSDTKATPQAFTFKKLDNLKLPNHMDDGVIRIYAP